MTVTEEPIEGFKETEIGLLPKDWEIHNIADIADVSSGGSAPQGEDYFLGTNPFIRVQHIELESDVIFRWDLITDEAVKTYKLKLFPKGTIVFPKSGASIYLEKRAMLPMDSYIVSHLCAINSKNSKLWQKYFFFSLKNIKFSKDKADGYPTLNLSEIKIFKIPLPPLPEQQKIASVLSTIQETKEKTENVISALKELKKSMMKHLFTYGAVSIEEAEKVPLKETEIGLIPKHWEIKRLEQVADSFIGGGTPSTKKSGYWNGDIHWTTSKKIAGLYLQEGERTITKMGLDESSTHLILKNNLIIGTRVGVGKVAVNLIDVAISQDLTGVVIDKKKHSHIFLAYELLSDRIQSLFLQQLRGTTIKGIPRDDLKKIILSLPPLPEQIQIAEIFTGIDAKIEAAVNKKNALESLFKTLLFLLMTGKIRVKDLEV